MRAKISSIRISLNLGKAKPRRCQHFLISNDDTWEWNSRVMKFAGCYLLMRTFLLREKILNPSNEIVCVSGVRGWKEILFRSHKNAIMDCATWHSLPSIVVWFNSFSGLKFNSLVYCRGNESFPIPIKLRSNCQKCLQFNLITKMCSKFLLLFFCFC